MTDFVHSATALKIGYAADHALSEVAIGYAFGGSEYGGGAEPFECKDIGGDDAKTKVANDNLHALIRPVSLQRHLDLPRDPVVQHFHRKQHDHHAETQNADASCAP